MTSRSELRQTGFELDSAEFAAFMAQRSPLSLNNIGGPVLAQDFRRFRCYREDQRDSGMAARMAFAATSSNGAAAGFIMRSHSRHASGLWSSASRSREGHAGGGPCTGPKSIRTPAAEKARISAERKANRTQKSGYAPKVSKGHKKGNTTPKSSGNPGK